MPQEVRLKTAKDGKASNAPSKSRPQIPSADEEKRRKALARRPIQTVQFKPTTSNTSSKTTTSKPPTEPPRNIPETEREPIGGGKRSGRSESYHTVYPERWQKLGTIGSNPISSLSAYHKSRLGLNKPEYDTEDEEAKPVEDDMNFIRRNLRQVYQSVLMFPAISCFLCCRAVCRANYEDSELDTLFQPRTHNGAKYLYGLKAALEAVPEMEWRTGVHGNLCETVENSIYTSNHLLKLSRIMNQFRVTLGFSHLYATGDPSTQEERTRLRGRSMIGALLYMATFSIAQLGKTDERMHGSTMGYIRQLYLEVVNEGVLLWASTCHIAATAEIILDDLEHVMLKYLYRVRPQKAKVVDLTAKNDYNEQARLRFELRREKRLRDDQSMRRNIHWPRKAKQPPLPDLQVVSRVEGVNVQWHPVTLFDFPSQVRIILNLLKRTKNAVADAFVLLSDFDQTLHTHRPSRKSAETETLFEDIIFLKDRFLDLNTYPKNLLNEKEVEELYELGRVLSDEMDDLYISLFAAKDLARETVCVAQLCHEYLISHERWEMAHYFTIAKGIQQEYHASWDHFEGFPGNKEIHPLEDSIPLFHASVYPSIIRIFPVKVAKLFLSFQSSGELLARREPSSHSLWDAFDTIDNPAFFKHSDTQLNKHEKG